jgi:hypothetical protein
MIRLAVHYPDDCPPSVTTFTTAEVAARVGEAMERLYPGATSCVEWWCDGCERWTERLGCADCGEALCESCDASECADFEEWLCGGCAGDRAEEAEGACCDHFCADCTTMHDGMF